MELTSTQHKRANTLFFYKNQVILLEPQLCLILTVSSFCKKKSINCSPEMLLPIFGNVTLVQYVCIVKVEMKNKKKCEKKTTDFQSCS